MTAYTLLIVESPTLAQIIDGFALPGVEVMATGGFSWQPIWDETKQDLKPKADPAWRSFRNQLKQKAPWASRIVVATDSDPAGSFISYAISRFLKPLPILRTNLNTLSRASVLQALDRSFSSDQDDYYVLRNRYLIHQILNRSLRDKLGSNSWAKLVLFYLFREKIPVTHFRGSQTIQLIQPVECYQGASISIKRKSDARQIILRKTAKPLNTSALLERLHDGKNSNSLASHQQNLNRLFTSCPDEIQNGLISYPRTSAEGYYAGTWELSYRHWIIDNGAETFLPKVLWDVLPDLTPHESLRPVNPVSDPSVVRPFIRKNLYDIYTVIYHHFMKTISASSIQPVEKIIINDGAKEQESEVVAISNEQSTYKAMITISDLLHTMNIYGAARPSGFGKLYGSLIKEKWIRESGIFIEPGIEFDKRRIAASFSWRLWLEELVAVMNNSTIEVSELKSTLDRMTQELPL